MPTYACNKCKKPIVVETVRGLSRFTEKPKPVIKVVTCPHCGAKNTFKVVEE